MTQASTQIAKQYMEGALNKKNWGAVAYNVLVEGLIGDGVTNDTAALQALINKAIAANRRTLLFPHGQYYVTALTNADQVDFVGDNSSFVGGYTGAIGDLGGFAALKAETNQRFNDRGVSVKDFGAKGDGVTDDTTAILNAIASGNKLILFPAGEYLISSKITIASSMTLMGEDKYRTFLKNNSVVANYIEITAMNTTIKNLGFKQYTTPTSGIALDIKASNVTVNEVYMSNVYTGISVAGCALCAISNLNINPFSNFGIILTNVNDVNLSKFLINAGQDITGTCIRLVDKVEALICEQGSCLNGLNSMTTDALSYAANARPAYSRFTDIFFDSAASGVIITNAVSLKFTSCWFSHRPGNGCILNQCDDISFSQCEFTNCGSHGALVQPNAKRVKFIGCSFISNNSQNNSSYGLRIAGGVSDFVVQGCTCTNGFGFIGAQVVGIALAGGASDRYIIADNLVSGNATGGVTDGGTGTNKRVANNY